MFSYISNTFQSVFVENNHSDCLEQSGDIVTHYLEVLGPQITDLNFIFNKTQLNSIFSFLN